MFSPIPEILDELRAGRMIVLTDDENRENEGDLVLPAQFVTPESVTFMLREARGYMCLSLTEADCDRLDLTPQTQMNTSVRGTPLTVSIDGHPRHGFTTGVSARERAETIRLAINPRSGPADFVRPGHINPLRSRDGGVLVRTGQTEGSLDLCRLAGLYPAAVIIEIMRDDGEMARVPDLERFCAKHGLKMCSVAQIVEHRLARERLVRRLDPIEGAPLHTPMGDFRLFAYSTPVDLLPHVALTVGDIGVPDAGVVPEITSPLLTRVHRRDLLGDVFEELREGRPPSGRQLRQCMHLIQREGRGVIVYLRPEGVGESLAQRLQRIRTREEAAADGPGPSTTWREIGVGCQILRDLGVSRLRLLSNSTTEHPGLDAFGIHIEERVPIPADED